MEICPKFEGINLSKKFTAKMEFSKIGPWKVSVAFTMLMAKS
jgi:hypothetical protein